MRNERDANVMRHPSSLGLISMEVIQVSLVNPVGVTSVIHSITFFAGSAGHGRTAPFRPRFRLGSSSRSPATATGGGASLASPSGAPLSAHFDDGIDLALLQRAIVRKWPYCGSANQGGIFRVATAAFIALAHGRVPS